MLLPRYLCLTLSLFLSLAKGAILPVTFDDDCSNVQCPSEPSLCPADSLERSPAPVFDVLYSPDEFMLPHEFYDDVADPAEEDHQYDDIPLQPSGLSTPTGTQTSTVSTTTVNSTSNVLLYTLAANFSESHEETESKRRKRELIFDDKHIEDADEHEHVSHTCCSTLTDEELQLRRRRRIRRHSTLEDCECKPCEAVPTCPSGEVLIKVQEAAGIPGACCPSWACAPKKPCDDVDVQPYWRDACTRCSCYGTNGPELCHIECPTLEEQETDRVCFTSDTLQAMEHGSVWYENYYCTKCHCENGLRDCVESLCKPTACKNPIKVSGQCCPQCSEDDENILVLHENSTHLNTVTSSTTELVPQTTFINATSSKPLGSTTAEHTTSTSAASTELTDKPTPTTETTLHAVLKNTTTEITSTSIGSTTQLTDEVSVTKESSTEPYSPQNETTSTETSTFELFNFSTSEQLSSSTELTSTAKGIDEIAAEGYFGPVDRASTENNTVISEEVTEKIPEDTSQASQTATSSSQNSSESEYTESMPSSSSSQVYELDSTSTTAMAGSSSMFSYSETSTEQSSSSTKSINDLSASLGDSTADTTSTVSTADAAKTTSSSITLQKTSEAISNTTETTTFMSSSPSSPTNTHMDSTTSSIITITLTETNSTQTRTPSTSSPYTSTANSPTSTTSSPFAYTSPASQPTSTITYWYTFSTSAPSPPMPQPTVYQPSVRQFFTRPEVRYIGAIVFVAFLGICALAVWKFCMPARSTRRKLKNHYRTVPSSEATSLSHSPTTSHSSMA